MATDPWSTLKFMDEHRPDLSMGTRLAYSSSLNAMMNFLKIERPITYDSIKLNIEAIMDYIAERCVKSRKVLLSALMVYCKEKNCELYDTLRDYMDTDSVLDRTKDEDQELTLKQKEAWLSWGDILSVREQHEVSYAHLLKACAIENKHDYNKALDYILISLYTLNAPRRALDYSNMVWDIETLDDNTTLNGIDWKSKEFVFNTYKTAKKYGVQRIKINEVLLGVLECWRKAQYSWSMTKFTSGKGNFILASTCGAPMASNALTKRLAKIFDKPGFGVNILRHAYVTNVALKDVPLIKELKEIATDLGHSMQETMLYKKNV